MDQYFHVKVVLGMVLGLAIATLLHGFARFVQHPSRRDIYWVHIGWTVFMFFFLTHFWWWEFNLSKVGDWDYLSYIFLVLYVVVLYLLCTLLYPSDISDYRNYHHYFMARRHWFFGLLALTYLLDFGDTLMKGMDYYRSLGIEYPLRNIGYILACLLAIFWPNERYHKAFVSVALIYELVWVYREYGHLG